MFGKKKNIKFEKWKPKLCYCCYEVVFGFAEFEFEFVGEEEEEWIGWKLEIGTELELELEDWTGDEKRQTVAIWSFFITSKMRPFEYP